MANDLDDSDRSSALMQITSLTMEGRAALAEGDGQRAFELLSRKHQRLLEVFARDSGSAGTSFVDLAEALHLLGKQREAREAIDTALAIFNRLDRHDNMRDRLERTLIDICRRQGHSFIVEELLRTRTTSAGGSSAEEDLRRAMEQDELAMMFFRRREYDKALPLLLDSKIVFERSGVSAHRELAVCCVFLSRVYLHTERFSDSVTYGRQAADYAAKAHGGDSLEVTMAKDELAVALAFSARKDGDPGIAREAISLSDSSAQHFVAQQGPNGKEAARSLENNRRLKQMLRSLLGSAEPTQSGEGGRSVALPTFCFISHAYADKRTLNALLQTLPKYVTPVVFEAIVAPPTEFVSEKLIGGVLDAEGMIFIDSEASHRSFWCAFERDLAARKQKPMFRFDPSSNAIEPVQVQPRELKLAHCFHTQDDAEVRRAMRWLVDERSFAAFHDEQLGEYSSPPFAEMPDEERQMRLFSLRTFGSLYLIFLSEALLKNDRLRSHVVDQLLNHPRGTVVCWVDSRPHRIPKDIECALAIFPAEHVVTFSSRPTETGFSVHSLDDLSVRLFWAHGRIRSGDWAL